MLEVCYKPLYRADNNLFKFVFNNASSLHAHFEDVKAEPNIINADIIGFAETRFVSRDLDTDFILPGFQLPIRNDQRQENISMRPYHGLVMYVKNDCYIEDIIKLSTPYL